MLRRVATALASLAFVVAVASGCGSEPDPVETTPGFATEEEAFAAAEETYRAYVDALNQVDLADPATFEPVFALTTGEANANERSNLSAMHADGWRVSGTTTTTGFRGQAYESASEEQTITAIVCSDVSAVQVVDQSGVSQTSPNRRNEYALEVRFTGTADELRIASSNAVEDPSCA